MPCTKGRRTFCRRPPVCVCEGTLHYRKVDVRNCSRSVPEKTVCEETEHNREVDLTEKGVHLSFPTDPLGLPTRSLDCSRSFFWASEQLPWLCLSSPLGLPKRSLVGCSKSVPLRMWTGVELFGQTRSLLKVDRSRVFLGHSVMSCDKSPGFSVSKHNESCDIGFTKHKSKHVFVQGLKLTLGSSLLLDPSHANKASCCAVWSVCVQICCARLAVA